MSAPDWKEYDHERRLRLQQEAASDLYEVADLLAGFAEHAATLDFNEDRNVSWAAVVAAKARAALARARGETA